MRKLLVTTVLAIAVTAGKNAPADGAAPGDAAVSAAAAAAINEPAPPEAGSAYPAACLGDFAAAAPGAPDAVRGFVAPALVAAPGPQAG